MARMEYEIVRIIDAEISISAESVVQLARRASGPNCRHVSPPAISGARLVRSRLPS
jgi:hypothetical protein